MRKLLEVGRAERRMRARTGQDTSTHRGRRGRCFAEIDFMMVRGAWPAAGNAGAAAATAPSIRCLIYESSRSPGVFSLTFRTIFPLPRRIFFGSGSVAPFRKHSVTHFGISASDNTASDGRSLGPKPKTSAL